jgi:hypothetical protein
MMKLEAENVEFEGNKEVNYKGLCFAIRADYSMCCGDVYSI